MSRPLCPRCERPLAACLCAWVRSVSNRVEVLLLQHPDEQGEAKGTAALLRLSLSNCVLKVGERFDPSELDDGRQSWLLYPGADAGAALPLPERMRLIVLDGSWRKSRKLIHLNPWLTALPRLSLADAPASRYASLRRADAAGQLSTLEATTLALMQLEQGNAAPYQGLLEAMDGFVAQQLAFRPTAAH
ncbi:tRNA-uridine aminocarboxypropyltransferase [Pelomonas sp. SE-A7]|uniref:tRNA-uridine aminocarboxypropyltransferase n=1 Tax=Pelomonas sp. SE-A7 TaxID=3054953 RepID=UPI00259D07AD|nr:tRNA-uridine aminocarboxypropyltransferase [Pelomonas sp. SE-A7]MDM4766516.1 tRNA-uridine aminocarboxypropyltransferase [Pelomonas sp. SE-A7]